MFAVLLMAPVFGVLYAAWAVARAAWEVLLFLLGLPGRPFGKAWLVPTRHVVWQTNFLATPPDDAALTHWLTAQPTVAVCELRRESYWLTFNCVLCGYILDPGGLKIASAYAAQTLGYDTGGRIAITDIWG